MTPLETGGAPDQNAKLIVTRTDFLSSIIRQLVVVPLTDKLIRPTAGDGDTNHVVNHPILACPREPQPKPNRTDHWLGYEEQKSLLPQNLDPDEHQRETRNIANRLGI